MGWLKGVDEEVDGCGAEENGIDSKFLTFILSLQFLFSAGRGAEKTIFSSQSTTSVHHNFNPCPTFNTSISQFFFSSSTDYYSMNIPKAKINESQIDEYHTFNKRVCTVWQFGPFLIPPSLISAKSAIPFPSRKASVSLPVPQATVAQGR